MRPALKQTARSRSSRCWPEGKARPGLNSNSAWFSGWVDPEKAISLIGEPELKSIVAKFAKRAAAAASNSFSDPDPFAALCASISNVGNSAGNRRALVEITDSANPVITVRHDERKSGRNVAANEQNGRERLAFVNSL
jgi:hypothetical protein